jgi:hypothetical protein
METNKQEKSIPRVLIGMSEGKAIALVIFLNMHVEIVERDGVVYPVETDFRINRVKMKVENKTVVEAYIG